MAGGNVIPSVYPVVLCGGRGERLWPLSRDGRSKAFLSLPGGAGFEATVARARRWADGRLIVCGAATERDAIVSALSAAEDPMILLEPDARNTAPAIAAAAVRVATDDPDAILLVLPADHDFGEDDAPAGAGVAQAAALARDEDVLVLLGAMPTEPSSAFGYIVASDPEPSGRRLVSRFVEKPAASEASALIAKGALWNCGIVVARARVLVAALAAHAPEVLVAAQAAVAEAGEEDGVASLSAAFKRSPAIAFDRAVLERAANICVVRFSGDWRDVGDWTRLWALSPKDGAGNAIDGDVVLEDCTDVLAFAEDGVRLVARGQRRVAVVATPRATLVSPLERDDASGPAERMASLGDWLQTAALPVWATLGWDEADGVFREALSQDGIPVESRRRTRVQARQVYVYASAALDAPGAPWGRVARLAMETLIARGRGGDGFYTYAPDLGAGEVSSDVLLYDQAFVLLALAAMARLEPDNPAWPQEADRLRTGLNALRHGPAYRENGEAPYQSNALMHLLEAAIAWTPLTGEGPWPKLAESLVEHALTRLIDPATGAIGETFDSNWGRPGAPETRLEPGHQYEWAWLLATWLDLSGDARCDIASRRLYLSGLRGRMPDGGVVNSLDGDFRPVDPAGRLWPHCEQLRAALRLGSGSDVSVAASALRRYLDTPVRGLWHERRSEAAGWIDAPAPATSLYHLYGAVTAARV